MLARPGAARAYLRTRTGRRDHLFTDGATDTLSPEGEDFGEDRLRQVIRANASLPVADLLRSARSGAGRFPPEHPLADDVTLVAVRTRQRRDLLIKQGGRAARPHCILGRKALFVQRITPTTLPNSAGCAGTSAVTSGVGVGLSTGVSATTNTSPGRIMWELRAYSSAAGSELAIGHLGLQHLVGGHAARPPRSLSRVALGAQAVILAQAGVQVHHHQHENHQPRHAPVVWRKGIWNLGSLICGAWILGSFSFARSMPGRSTFGRSTLISVPSRHTFILPCLKHLIKSIWKGKTKNPHARWGLSVPKEGLEPSRA